MEIDTFQATDVPELFTLDNGTIYFLVESVSVDDEGLTYASPFKISLGDLLSNVFSNNLYNIINTPNTNFKSLSRSANKTLNNNLHFFNQINSLQRQINQLNNQINLLLSKLSNV